MVFAVPLLWDFPIEGGETLRDVHARVLPFHKDHVMPHLTIGKTVLVVLCSGEFYCIKLKPSISNINL
jgi:hypothetical protein